MKQPLVLIVDDAPEIVLFIKTVLEDDYRIETAYSGESALEMAKLKQPDLILLDILMPGMNGYETCKALKDNPDTNKIPIIMVSGMDEEGDEVIGLQAGAVDYITKPISIAILQARINNQLLLLATRRELEHAHHKISTERKYIEVIIDKMRNAYDFNSQFVRHASHSPELNSGDLVLSAFRPDHSQCVMVADFTGHGLPAAIGGTLVTYIFYKCIRENKPLPAIISEINTVLSNTLPVNIFMASAIAEVNPERNQAKLWNYGMEDILLLNTDNSWQNLSSMGCALGIIKSPNVDPHYDIELDSLAYLFLLTDGVTEAADHENQQEMFGIERLKTLLLSSIQQNESLDKVLKHITEYVNSPGDFDDMTLLELNIH